MIWLLQLCYSPHTHSHSSGGKTTPFYILQTIAASVKVHYKTKLLWSANNNLWIISFSSTIRQKLSIQYVYKKINLLYNNYQVNQQKCISSQWPESNSAFGYTVTQLLQMMQDSKSILSHLYGATPTCWDFQFLLFIWNPPQLSKCNPRGQQHSTASWTRKTMVSVHLL